MRTRILLAAIAVGCVLALTSSSGIAATLRWAHSADVDTLDPYSRTDFFSTGFMLNIYEPLVRRNPDFAIEPALAMRWEAVDPTTWRFHLRQGVKFREGEPFTADDVVFSYKRSIAPGSEARPYFSTVKEVKKVDQHTVDFILASPDPLLPETLSFWPVMNEAWSLAHDAALPTIPTKSENFASRNVNGTGPYFIASRDAGRRTILQPNPDWWGKSAQVLPEVQFSVIGNPGTRAAALLSGDLDVLTDLPLQDIARIEKVPGLKVIERPETRTIFFGFDQSRDELLKSDVKGKNPFKDVRVRRAFNHAVDVDAIHKRVMRGHSLPLGVLYPREAFGYTKESDQRYPYDLAKAKQLLADAGYPQGFGVTLDCPTDRYVNDEQICQAVTAMLAQVGIRVTLNAQTRSLFFAEVNPPRLNTSFYIWGWGLIAGDGYNTLKFVAASRRGPAGIFNLGNYSNEKFDGVLKQIAAEGNRTKRRELMEQSAKILHDDAAFIPLHQQTIIWAARQNIDVPQLPDGQFPLRLVVMK